MIYDDDPNQQLHKIRAHGVIRAQHMLKQSDLMDEIEIAAFAQGKVFDRGRALGAIEIERIHDMLCLLNVSLINATCTTSHIAH